MLKMYFQNIRIRVLAVSEHYRDRGGPRILQWVLDDNHWSVINLIFMMKITPSHGFTNGRRAIRPFNKFNLTTPAPGGHQVTRLQGVSWNLPSWNSAWKCFFLCSWRSEWYKTTVHTLLLRTLLTLICFRPRSTKLYWYFAKNVAIHRTIMGFAAYLENACPEHLKTVIRTPLGWCLVCHSHSHSYTEW